MTYRLQRQANDSPYTYGGPLWLIALAKSPSRQKIVQTVCSFESCRESLCWAAADALKSTSEDYRYHDSKFESSELEANDRRYTNLVIFSKLYPHSWCSDEVRPNHSILEKNRSENIQKALCVINSLERNADWPLTKIHRIVENHRGQKFHPADIFYYVRGSYKWMRAPSLLSLYGILLRCSTLIPVKNKKITSSEKDVFLSLQAEVRKLKKPTGTYLKAALCYGLPFLQKMDVLFKGRTERFNYGVDRFKNRRGEISIEGFQRLISGSTRDHTLRARVVENVMVEMTKDKE